MGAGQEHHVYTSDEQRRQRVQGTGQQVSFIFLLRLLNSFKCQASLEAYPPPPNDSISHVQLCFNYSGGYRSQLRCAARIRLDVDGGDASMADISYVLGMQEPGDDSVF